MKPRILIARSRVGLRRPLLAVAGTVGQLLLGLLVVIVRVIRALVDLAAEALMRAEHRVAATTGRPAISQTVVGAIARAFVTEFFTAYTTTTNH